VIGDVPFLWCFLIKQFIPHVLIILFINLATSKRSNGDPLFGNFGGYENQPFQALGILTFVFTLVLVIVGVIFPQLYETLALAQVDDYDHNDDAEPKAMQSELVFNRVEGVADLPKPVANKTPNDAPPDLHFVVA